MDWTGAPRGGGTTRGQSAALHCFWYIGFGCFGGAVKGAVGQGRGGSCHAGGKGLLQVVGRALTAVMHGVAGDDHR